jgi:hypothetical protein
MALQAYCGWRRMHTADGAASILQEAQGREKGGRHLCLVVMVVVDLGVARRTVQFLGAASACCGCVRVCSQRNCL